LFIFYFFILKSHQNNIDSFQFVTNDDNNEKILVGNKLKNVFLNSNLNVTTLTNFKQSLFEFQKKLIKLRNEECIIKSHIKHFNSNDYLIDYSNEKLVNFKYLLANFSTTSTTTSYNNNDSILFDKIINNFNNMVYCYCILYLFIVIIIIILFLFKKIKKCISSSIIIDLFSNNATSLINYEYLFQLVLTQLTNPGCDLCNEHKLVDTITVTKLESI
jgi:hypothetical protein